MTLRIGGFMKKVFNKILFSISTFLLATSFVIVAYASTGVNNSTQRAMYREDKAIYIDGNSDGCFFPEGILSRAEIATMLQKIEFLAPNESIIFSDTASHWAKYNISTVANKRYMIGNGNEFRPDDTMTIAEFSKVIHNIFNGTLVTTNVPAAKEFNDVKGHWAKKEIEFMSRYGFINGYEDGSFKPDKYISRVEAVVILNRVYKYDTPYYDQIESKNKNKFKDITEAYWAYKDIILASCGTSR